MYNRMIRHLLHRPSSHVFAAVGFDWACAVAFGWGRGSSVAVGSALENHVDRAHLSEFCV